MALRCVCQSELDWSRSRKRMTNKSLNSVAYTKKNLLLYRGKGKLAFTELPWSDSTVFEHCIQNIGRNGIVWKKQGTNQGEIQDINGGRKTFGIFSSSLFSSYKILLDELSSTKHWASTHVSDHSGFHYRQFLLKSLISQTVKDSSVLEKNPMRSEPALVLPKDEAAAASPEKPRITIPHLLEEEVEFSTDLIDSYPGHETLWCHR